MGSRDKYDSCVSNASQKRGTHFIHFMDFKIPVLSSVWKLFSVVTLFLYELIYISIEIDAAIKCKQLSWRSISLSNINRQLHILP